MPVSHGGCDERGPSRLQLQLQLQPQPFVTVRHPARTAEGPVSRITPGHRPDLMAEDGGFEPPRACTQHAFQLGSPVSADVGVRLSVQVIGGGPAPIDAHPRSRTSRNCYRNRLPAFGGSKVAEAVGQWAELVVDDVEDQVAINSEVFVHHDVPKARRSPPTERQGSGHVSQQAARAPPHQ